MTIQLAVVVLITLALSGCRRPSLETVPVAGTVTYQGKPVPYGVVSSSQLMPVAGVPPWLSSSPAGRTMCRPSATVRGLVPGEYVVTVTVEKPAGVNDDRRQPQPGVRSPDEFPRLVRSGIKFSVGAGDPGRSSIFHSTGQDNRKVVAHEIA